MAFRENPLKLGFGLMRLPKNPDGSICYIIGVLKAIRNKLNKHDGDTIHVVIEAEEDGKKELTEAYELGRSIQ